MASPFHVCILIIKGKLNQSLVTYQIKYLVPTVGTIILCNYNQGNKN